LCGAVIFAPFLLVWPVTAISAGENVNDGWLTALWYSVLGPPAVTVVFLALPFAVYLVNWWGALSYHYRSTAVQAAPIDWGNPRWASTAAALQRAGVDPHRLGGLAAFTRRANLRAILIPRMGGRRYQRMSDWSHKRRNRRMLMVLGGTIGVLLAFFESAWKDWWDAYATSALILFAAICLPIAALTARKLVALNVRDPMMHVIIPVQWRAALRRTPQCVVLLLHEVAHVAHRDMLHRQIVVSYSPVAGFCVLFTIAPVLERGSGYTMVGIIAIGSGITAVHRAARTVPLLQELRADASACIDRDAYDELVRWLTRANAEKSSSRQNIRLQALTEDGLRVVARRTRIALLLGMLGYAAPALAAPLL
jgi:hypothetical protein